jgi:hypothetical protein
MRTGDWIIDNKKPRKNEIKVEPGRRPYWSLIINASHVQVESILNALGIP